jgi:hypothetical protein
LGFAIRHEDISTATIGCNNNEFAKRHESNSGTATVKVFSVISLPRCYNTTSIEWSSGSRVEAGSNTSTVALRVVGGDEKGSPESVTEKYGTGERQQQL